MVSSKRRVYTKAQREAVLADVPSVGVVEASQKHGVPQSCASRWAKAAGVKRTTIPVPSEIATPEPAPAASSAATKRTRRTRVAKVYTPSQKAVVLEDAAKDGVTSAAKKHGISRFSIYDWQRKVIKAAAGEGPSPTSGPAPKDIE